MNCWAQIGMLKEGPLFNIGLGTLLVLVPSRNSTQHAQGAEIDKGFDLQQIRSLT